jgi:hypothetical protein
VKQLASVAIWAALVLVPTAAHAQNTSFGTSVHLLVGQTPMRVTLTSGATATRYYDAPVVLNRSYCAEATASDTEVNATDPTLTIFHDAPGNAAYAGLTDTGNAEPKGGTAARVCFIATATENVFLQLTPASAAFENREYTLRFVETTAFTNWFFVGGGYSSFTLIRNTTDAPINYSLFWRNAAGTILDSVTGSIPGNGIIAIDARTRPNVLAALSGSAELAHNGSPEAVVGSQTTLSGGTGLSFDTLYFQRRAW